jgi:NAD dependent epimerase/dehydratase family enzyme
MSWIHETDMNRLFERALLEENMKGVYVASSPNPVSNAEFMRHLRRMAPSPKVPLALPAFAWMVKAAAPLLLRTDPELALYGRYVKSTRLEREGFEFSYPDLDGALGECLGTPAT